MNNKIINLSAYDEFEKLDGFGDKLAEYRNNKLDSANGHVSFIRKNFPGNNIRVFELGSGNSKTLYALEKAGILESGVGIEISKSRHEFAEKWKKDGGYKRVVNLNMDVLDLNMANFKGFNLCFCVDLAFQFFEPIKNGGAYKVLKDVCDVLPKGGRVILELDDCKRILDRMLEGNVRLWEEFTLPDPWRFSLWDCYYDSKKHFLEWKKTFVRRDVCEFSETSMILRVYSRLEMCEMLRRVGFSKVELYSSWCDGEKVKNGDEYIVVGVKG